ncbi:hypothetical protein C8D77_107159 [Mesorhizobium loti]|uniref:Uncharacterized protein n=1 Tax=Rhizobium loti TaxID=381 RepID=A0A8E2WA72_RHILI|nr:hypothetical protein [Mesorhizobium loti]PWJ89515.1 hypothetical protein C8D77_107159 [Mesorhizobium loti]
MILDWRSIGIVLIAGAYVTVCHAAGEKSCIQHFLAAQSPAPAKVAAIVKNVSSAIGLARQIQIVPCTSVTDAEAFVSDGSNPLMPEGSEYIIYNPQWVQQVAGDHDTELVTIFGHEMGHLLNGDFTANKAKSRHDKEAAADQFAGCAVARLHGEKDQMDEVLLRLRSAPDGSAADDTYPSADESLEQAHTGFDHCPQPPDDKEAGQPPTVTTTVKTVGSGNAAVVGNGNNVSVSK